jgi:hypothetical protein
MKYLNITLLTLIIIISSSCDRMAKEKEAIIQAKNQDVDIKFEVQENIGRQEENLQLNDSLIRAENISPERVMNSQLQNEKSNSQIGKESGNSGLNWWMYGALFSIIFNLFLIFLLIKTVKSKNKYVKERDYITIGKDKYKREANIYKDRLSKLEDKKRKKQFSNTESQNRSIPREIIKPSIDTEEKAVEVNLSVTPSSKTRNQTVIKSTPVILYTEKANENKIFTSISDQKNEHRSVFKLILDNPDSEKASFEIVDSDFILKMVANSPDTYLYPVCKPENSNQNYSGEIITTKKGIAHKVDGKWKVNEEDKATIKFQ